MFGKKYRCFGCKRKTKKYSKVVCIKEIGTLGISYLQATLCPSCAERLFLQIYDIQIKKVKRIFHIEDSIYNT